MPLLVNGRLPDQLLAQLQAAVLARRDRIDSSDEETALQEASGSPDEPCSVLVFARRARAMRELELGAINRRVSDLRASLLVPRAHPPQGEVQDPPIAAPPDVPEEMAVEIAASPPWSFWRVLGY
jgi:hypothetical protein